MITGTPGEKNCRDFHNVSSGLLIAEDLVVDSLLMGNDEFMEENKCMYL